MQNNFITAITKDLAIRAYAVDTTEIVQRAYEIHKTTSLASAALGRTLTAASMMGAMLKAEQDSITVQIRGNGPLGAIICVSDSSGNVRGYIQNPSAKLPLNPKNGKINVGAGIGKGSLTVIKDLGLKEPYVGQISLVSGEIAEDITSYFANSEQVPTICALGVLVNADNTIAASGGYIIQLLPFTEDEIIDRLEENIKNIPSVTQMLSEGDTPSEMLRIVLKGFEVEILQERRVEYRCYCSRERVERALISMGQKELKDLIDEQGSAEITCQFCDIKYQFSKEQLISLLNQSKNNVEK